MLSAELVPGNYTLTAPASVTAGQVWSSETVLTRLAPGTVVRVVEVVRRDDLRRVQGRIDGAVEGNAVAGLGITHNIWGQQYEGEVRG